LELATHKAPSFNINPFLNFNHLPVFKSESPELLVYGGAGAGKSYSIADKLLLQSRLQSDRDLKAVVIRKSFPSLRATAMDILDKRAKTLRMPWRMNKSEWVAKCDRMTFHFHSLHHKEDYSKLKSLTDVDYVWINEVPEIREDDYDEILRRVRGGDGLYDQVISDFNPIGKYTWVYKRFFQKNIGNVQKLRYTVLDNHPDYLNTEKAQRYIKRLKATKDYNLNHYKIYFKGEWGELKGVIYDWDIVDFPPENPDEIFYGGDFGFSVNEAAVVRIYRKALEFWVEEVVYQTELTNQALAKKCLAEGVEPKAYIYWDCAEPKSITEVKQAGLRGSKPCVKGPDSVKAGIDYLKSVKIHIIDGSENIKSEQKGYVWKVDKDGNSLNEPIKFNDHAMKAIQYGIYTHMRGSGKAIFTFTDHDMY